MNVPLVTFLPLSSHDHAFKCNHIFCFLKCPENKLFLTSTPFVGIWSPLVTAAEVPAVFSVVNIFTKRHWFCLSVVLLEKEEECSALGEAVARLDEDQSKDERPRC